MLSLKAMRWILLTLCCGVTFSLRLPAQTISITPTTLSFGYVQVGTTSPYQQLKVANTGTAPLTISAWSITPPQFAIASADPTPVYLDPGESTVVDVTFSPATDQSYSGTFTASSNATPGSNTVSLTGAGAYPQLSLSPSAVSFGNQNVSSTSADVDVKISNTGRVPASMSGITISPQEFAISSATSTPTTLQPGESTTAVLTFTPQGDVSYSGQFAVAYQGQPPSSAALSGTGVGSSPLVVGTTSVALAYKSEPYPPNAAMTASGGTPPYTWALFDQSGPLPSGLSLSSGGSISGTPTQYGQFSPVIQVTDSSSPPLTATKSFSLLVDPGSYDKYGGVASAPCSDGPAPHFYTEEMSGRWWLCTPAGNSFWMRSVADVESVDDNGSSSGGDYQGVYLRMDKDACTESSPPSPTSPCSVVAEKYQTGGSPDEDHWGAQAVQRLKSWEFNATAEYAESYVQPVANPGATLPYVAFDGPAKYSRRQSLAAAYGLQPVKDLAEQLKQSVYSGYAAETPDVWDQDFGEYFKDTLLDSTIDPLYPDLYGSGNDYLIGLYVDDTDDLFGYGAGPQFEALVNGQLTSGKWSPNLAWIILVTAPSQSSGVDYSGFDVYADTKVYSKAELATFLENRYGSVANLNAAWGSNYSTFGSTATNYTGVAVASADGSAKSFTASLSTPISPLSVSVYEGGSLVAGDDASGPRSPSPSGAGGFRPTPVLPGGAVALCGDGSVGCTASSVNYTTGQLTLTFATPPPAGTVISVNYSTGGWGLGTGLLDEDGACPSKGTLSCWVPSDAVSLQGATAAMTTDLDDFLESQATQYFSTIRNVLNNLVDPQTNQPIKVLYLGPTSLGSWGDPSRAQILKAASSYLDVASIPTVPTLCSSCTDDQARIDFINANLGNLPWIEWEGLTAQNDSYFSQGECGCDPASPSSAPDSSTQQDRGALFEQMVAGLLSAKDSATNTYHVVGYDWWQYYDSEGEKTNWGLLTRRDNAYDGAQSTTSTGADAWGYQAGGEQQSYGDFIDDVITANLNVYKTLLGIP